MKKLTLAVAAYKIAPFIRECLESIRAQSNQDFVFLVVDDGSPDDTGKVIDAFAQECPDMQVLHQKNGGISRVRNKMIDMCQTEYLWMIDGDDTIPKDAVERLLPCLDGEREAVYFTYTRYGEKDERALSGKLCDLSPEQVRAMRYKSMLRDNEPLIRNINANSSVMSAHLVSVLRKRDVRFEPGRKVAQDVLFTSQFLVGARRLAYLDASLYYYRVNEGSTSLRYHSDFADTSLDWLDVFTAFINENYPGDERMLLLLDGRVVGTVCSAFQLDICHPDNPNGYFARRKRFFALIDRERVQKAFTACPNELLGRNVRLYRDFVRARSFFLVNLMARTIMRKRYIVFRAHGGKK